MNQSSGLSKLVKGKGIVRAVLAENGDLLYHIRKVYPNLFS